MSPKIRLMMVAGTAFAASAVNAQNLDQTRAYAAEVMADAEQRTSLLGAADHGGQFSLNSQDGSSTLNIGGWTQTRYTLTVLDDDGGAQDDFETGFSVPDTTLDFNGSVVSPDTTFAVRIVIDESGGFWLDNAFIAHDWGNGTSGKAGQFDTPLTREGMLEDNHTQKIERSTTDMVFGGGLTQGIAITHGDANGGWQIIGSFNDGANTAGTPYNASNDGDWGATGRFDFAIEGSVEGYHHTLRKVGTGHETALIVGGYIHGQQSPDQPGAGDVDILQAGVDLLWDHTDGWNLYAAGHLRRSDIDVGLVDDDFLDLGLLLQGGYFVQDNTELFAFWDCVNPDDDRAGDADPFNTIGGGVNFFPFDNTQAVKLSAQVNIFIDATTETGGLVMQNTNNGLLTDNEGGQVSVLTQAQVTF